MSPKPYEITNLKKLLSEDFVHFTYKKSDNGMKHAIGTTNLELIPEEKHPKEKTEVPPDVIIYYDVHDKKWQSFHKDLFLEIASPHK